LWCDSIATWLLATSTGVAPCDWPQALQIGMNGAVLGGEDLPTRLRLPRRAFNFLREQVRRRCGVSCPDEFLVLLGQISLKARDALRFEPGPAVRDFDVGKYVRDGVGKVVQP
jgi:hypothetical protein